MIQRSFSMSVSSIEECTTAVLSKEFDDNVIIHSMTDLRRLSNRKRIKEAFLTKLRENLNAIGFDGKIVSNHYVVTALPIETIDLVDEYVLKCSDVLPTRIFVVKDKELYLSCFSNNTTIKLVSDYSWSYKLVSRLNDCLGKMCKVRRVGLYNNIVRLRDQDITEILLNLIALHDIEYHEQIKSVDKVSLKLVDNR